MKFGWVARVKGNGYIEPEAQEIEASDFTHALQKIAARVHKDTNKISVWKLDKPDVEP